MGCPAPKITGNGEGSALMKEPLHAAKVIEGLMTLHEKRAKIDTPTQEMGSGNTFVQNQIVYQGTTTDALKALRDGVLDVN